MNNRRIIVIILFSGLLSAQGWFRQKTVEDRFNKAVEYYNEGRFGAAESALSKIGAKGAEEYQEAMQLMLMKSKYRSGDFDGARSIGISYIHNMDYTDYQHFIVETLGDIFVEDGNYSAALRQYLIARRTSKGDNVFTRRLNEKVSRLFGLNISKDVISELFVTDNDTVNQIILRLVEAFQELNQSNPEQAAQQLSYVYPEYVPDELFAIYEQLILASYQEKSTIVTIGIVASLTGLDSNEGRIFLRGIQQAFKHHLQVGHKVSYIILDNVSDEIETARAISALLTNPSITAIVAPLGSRDALIAASMVNNSTIPIIIPASMQDGLTDLSPNIFQFNSNLSMRGVFAARYAMQKLNATSIAVIAPADAYGKTLVDAFIKELDINGIVPVRVEWYSEDPKNLKSEFTSIRKTAWSLVPEEDTDEQYFGMALDSLDALFDVSTEDFFDLPEEENKKKLSRSDSTEVVLETIQALYIPAHAAEVSYLGTQFPVYNLKTTIIGTEGWNNLDILNEGSIGPHVNGMVVISSEYPNERIDEVLPENISNPSVFYLGYDTAQMLLHVAAKTHNDPSAFAMQLSNVDGIHGKFHSYSFDKSHKNVNTALHVLKYENESFRDLGFFQGDSLAKTYYPAP